MQRLLLSAAVLVLVAGVGIGATRSFFSDTETSTGNTFAAGDIDLQIDNESYIQATSTQGVGPSNMLAWAATSWTLADLEAGRHKFFDFVDLKPGDLGEDTISIHVGSNNAYLCAAAQLTSNSDMSCTEPEQADENGDCVEETTGGTHGDLAGQLNFAFWVDDGDNVYETGSAPEQVLNPTSDGGVFLRGPLSGLGSQGQIALADNSGNAPFGTSVPGNSTIYIGKVWCFGTLTPTPVAQDGLGSTTPNTNGPVTRGTGWSCNGAPLNNIAQTDQVQGDMQFYAEQSRNNPNFTCEENYNPVWPAS